MAGGGEVAYALTGSGPFLLMAPGWLSHLELGWAIPTERMFHESLSSGRTLVRYDRPGCGLSDAYDGPRTMALELATIAAVTEELGITSCEVLGWSLGAAVAVQWKVHAPTLVLHRGGDRAAPLDQGKVLAEEIPGARLVELEGRSHLPAFGDVGSLVDQIRRFLALPRLRRSVPTGLTERQEEVAALVAEGLTNRDLADRLSITERSAESHLERIRLRLGFRSRSQIAAWYVAQNPHK